MARLHACGLLGMGVGQKPRTAGRAPLCRMATTDEIAVLVDTDIPREDLPPSAPPAAAIAPVHVHTMPRTVSEENRNVAAALAASLGGLSRQISATASAVVPEGSALRRLKSKPEFLCKICYCNDAVGDDMIELSCGHRWHKDCLLGLIKSRVTEAQLVIPCPDVPDDVDERALLDNAVQVGCETLITKETIFSLASELGDDELPKTFIRFEEMTSNPNMRECPQPGCSHRQLGDPRRPQMVCEMCGQQYCFVHATSHPPTQSCASYERQEKAKRLGHDKFVKQTSLNCPGCSTPTSKTIACNHMTCANPKCKLHWVCATLSHVIISVCSRPRRWPLPLTSFY